MSDHIDGFLPAGGLDWSLECRLPNMTPLVTLGREEAQARAALTRVREALNSHEEYVELGERVIVRRSLISYVRLVPPPAKPASWLIRVHLTDCSVTLDLTGEEAEAASLFAEARGYLGATSPAKYVLVTSDLIVDRAAVQYLELEAASTGADGVRQRRSVA